LPSYRHKAFPTQISRKLLIARGPRSACPAAATGAPGSSPPAAPRIWPAVGAPRLRPAGSRPLPQLGDLWAEPAAAPPCACALLPPASAPHLCWPASTPRRAHVTLQRSVRLSRMLQLASSDHRSGQSLPL